MQKKKEINFISPLKSGGKLEKIVDILLQDLSLSARVFLILARMPSFFESPFRFLWDSYPIMNNI